MPDSSSSDSSSAGDGHRKQLWCVCRSSDTGRFMVGCDKCEEWFHGDCIGVTPKQADAMLNYYCKRCLKRFPNLRIVWKEEAGGDGECRRKQPVATPQSLTPLQPPPPPQLPQRSPLSLPPPPTPPPLSQSLQQPPAAAASRRRRREPAAATASGIIEDQQRRQCEGPGCRMAALRGSAYCCQACGVARAKRRLVALLPPRLAAWQARAPVAERRDSLRLARVRQAAEAARRRLTEGELRHQALDCLLARGRRLRPGVPEEPGLPGEDDVTMPCPSCSQETSVRSALRHLIKCQQRIESRTSFGSPFPSQMDGPPLFCDRYCQSSRAYCKKLAVLCPDHYRGDAAEGGDGACGCPLTDDELAGPLCPVGRQKCTRHFAWARLRRAEIDIDRMRQLMRLEELLFEERAIRQAMMRRGGALSLLLHSTTDHQPGVNLPVVEQSGLGPSVPPNHVL